MDDPTPEVWTGPDELDPTLERTAPGTGPRTHLELGGVLALITGVLGGAFALGFSVIDETTKIVLLAALLVLLALTIIAFVGVFGSLGRAMRRAAWRSEIMNHPEKIKELDSLYELADKVWSNDSAVVGTFGEASNLISGEAGQAKETDRAREVYGVLSGWAFQADIWASAEKAIIRATAISDWTTTDAFGTRLALLVSYLNAATGVANQIAIARGNMGSLGGVSAALRMSWTVFRDRATPLAQRAQALGEWARDSLKVKISPYVKPLQLVG